MSQIKAPWTAEQVMSLYRWQKNDSLHPFTCGSGHRTDYRHLDNEGVLIPTSEGWRCPYCDYRQDWAHDFMLDGSRV